MWLYFKKAEDSAVGDDSDIYVEGAVQEIINTYFL